MNKTTLLERIESEYDLWKRALTLLAEGELAKQGVSEGWSAKDIVAHVTWGEQEMTEMLRQRAMVGSELWLLSQDERNAAVFEQNRPRPLAEVLDEAPIVHVALIDQISRLDDEDLVSPAHFPPMPAEWEPWKLIAGCTFLHYPEHRPAMEVFAASMDRQA